MNWQPLIDPETARLRARMLAGIRRFFHQRDVLEVTTPVLSACGVTDPHIESVGVHDGTWLRTSPEYRHKRLLAAGFGDLYEIGPAFRQGEHGHRHRREFTLLEWYRLGWTWQALAEEVIALIEAVSAELGYDRAGTGVDWMTWHEAFARRFDIDPDRADAAALKRLAGPAAPEGGRHILLDWLFATGIQPALAADRITVICDFPPEQAALARIRPGKRPVAERFEIFIGDMELANGYQELTDAETQQQRFEEDNRQRRRLGRPEMPIDAALLSALQAGLPECAGVALGVDRLVMAIGGIDDIGRLYGFAD